MIDFDLEYEIQPGIAAMFKGEFEFEKSSGKLIISGNFQGKPVTITISEAALCQLLQMLMEEIKPISLLEKWSRSLSPESKLNPAKQSG